MPYKRTGRPPGRPRKLETDNGYAPAPVKPVSVKPAYAQKDSRLRKSYRAIANQLNPNPAVQVYDSRGRPRKPTNHHKWL